MRSKSAYYSKCRICCCSVQHSSATPWSVTASYSFVAAAKLPTHTFTVDIEIPRDKERRREKFVGAG